MCEATSCRLGRSKCLPQTQTSMTLQTMCTLIQAISLDDTQHFFVAPERPYQAHSSLWFWKQWPLLRQL